MSRIAAIIPTVVTVLLLAGSAEAILSDHLQCFTIKDPQAKTTYTATLTPSDMALPVAPGCTIKVPAKLLCVDVEKSAVTPLPPGAAPGAQAQKYLCYKVKCPKTPQLVPVQDQFGSRTVKVNASSFLCAPFPAPTTTTTTTTSTTSTTSTTIFMCVTNNQCPSPPNAQGACVSGQCTFTCNPGFADCNATGVDGCEVSLNTSPSNCGGCGMVCSNNNISFPTCTGGTCTGACNAGFGDCNNNKQVDGCETSLNTPTNCGTCGLVCASHPNAVPQCTGGSCGFSCNAGFANCNGLNADGCEVSLLTDPSNCGVCGAVCVSEPNSTSLCTAGSCSLACNAGFANCNGLNADGCEVSLINNPNDCGACGSVCPPSFPTCVITTCQ